MNKLGVHAAVFAGGWSPSDCDSTVRRARACGFDVVEIPVFEPDTLSPAATRQALERHGMEATCSVGLPFDADLASDDGAVSAAGERYLLAALDFAAAVGSTYLGGVIYGAFGKHSGPPTAAGRDNAAGALRRVARRALDHGITLGLETVNRYESNLLNTAAQTRAFIAEIGAANIAVHLDTYHMNIEEDDLARAVADSAGVLGYVHIGESHRGALGTGTVDFAAVFGALREIGYDGVMTFESFSSRVVSPGLSSTLAVWRDTWDDPDATAASARRFIASALAGGGA
ncbi:sugar phosphate isomerase/epimerase family protein [Nonomuraea guangzhouensis]|uniref:Sugar phosphate isomerase/epimerase family protein n=1 Tax=Nonomuraea guangzhouensis TaxID=1291555 RepID=A0ABW4G7Q5_9ACTN|nr:sugar phosphate isomerase/epimerase family protein [Nonomuraea guangzhouensis]